MTTTERRKQRWTSMARATGRRLLQQARTILFTEPQASPTHDDAEVAAAEEQARSAGDLKGGVAKVAQLMAYLEGPGAAHDDNARRLLGALWDRAPGVDVASIRAVVSADLGAPVEERFDRWDEVPIAAASLGQVHAATARGGDGTVLAVKVQYPAVAEALRADLESKTIVRKLAGAGVGGSLSEASIATLRDAVLGELDYTIEGQFLQRFRTAFVGHPRIVVPRFFPALSSARVLTAERLTGRTLAELAATGRPAERAAVALAIFHFAWGAPLRHGLLNADPNPGNYLVLDDGRVGFFDFGCALALDETVVEVERAMWKAVLKRDGEALRYAVHVEGLLGRAVTLDTDTFRMWERFVAGPFLATEPWAWTPAYARGLAEVTSTLVRAGGLTLPPHALLLWRQRLGVAAVIASLCPTADFRRALGEILAD